MKSVATKPHTYARPANRQKSTIHWITRLVAEHHRLFLLATLFLLVILAWTNRFVQDDAFISFRYARHLADGHGLTWNVGEAPVEGYTNFLWVLIMTIPHLLNIEVVAFCYVLGMVLVTGTLLCTYRLTDLLLESKPLVLLAVVLLGTNYTFSAYATSGLETQLQTLLITAAALVTGQVVKSKEISPQAMGGLSLLFTAALMTRLDSAIFVGVLGLVLLFEIHNQQTSRRKKGALLAALCAPALLLVGGWLGWKLWYYGDILPNTFYAKGTSNLQSTLVLGRGLRYVDLFFQSYWLIPFPFLIAASFKRLTQKQFFLSALVLSVLLWSIYIVKVGGGFMEFRFFVPVLPFFFIAVSWLISRVISNQMVSIALIGLIMAGTLHHAMTFELIKNDEVGFLNSFPIIHTQLEAPNRNWDEVGKTLHRLFYNERADVTIATHTAGIIPYYSQLKTIDMFGLNDKWVARNGVSSGSITPGHQRIAPLDYLIERDANLFIGDPVVRPRSKSKSTHMHSVTDLTRRHFTPITMHNIPAHAKMLYVPINERYELRLIYLVQNDYVDHVIEERNLQTHPILEAVRKRKGQNGMATRSTQRRTRGTRKPDGLTQK